MKIIIRSLVIAVVSFGLVLSGFSVHAAEPKKRVGILLWNDALRYHQVLDVVMKQLNADGFTELNTDIRIKVAQSSKVAAMRISKDFEAQKMDLYAAIGASAALAMTREIKTAPVVCSMAYDSERSGIAASWQGADNVIQVTFPVPVEKLLTVLKRIVPVKRLAVFYTPGERNSEVLLKGLADVEKSMGIRVISVPLVTLEDVPRSLAYLKGRADAVFLMGSCIVDIALLEIIETANRLGIVTVSYLLDYADRGVCLAVGSNAHNIGQRMSRQITMILKGLKPVDVLSSEEQKADVIVNMHTARRIGLKVPDDVLEEAAKVIY